MGGGFSMPHNAYRRLPVKPLQPSWKRTQLPPRVLLVAGEATKIGGVAKFIHFNVYTSHLRFVSGVTNGVGVEKLFGALGVETFS